MAEEADMTITRERMEFDIVIVGAGPSGLSAAIRLAQLNQLHQKSISICVLEKGKSVGAQILSGAAIETTALNELIPDWKEKNAPLNIPTVEDHFYLLTKKHAVRLPTPRPMKNKGNYIISLGKFCIWLAQQAEALGVNIFPGFPGSKLLFDGDRVVGIQTGDFGLNAKGEPTERFQPGIEIYSKQVILSEGCRGSLTEQIIKKYSLREKCDPQTYGIGIKELWKIDPKNHHAGRVSHTIGWPLDHKTYGGSFIYHYEENLLALGFIIGLDYQNPYLNPYEEFQRFKQHPMLRALLENGQCITYGSRALNEGGWQSLPKLSFPGGILIGDAAGFLNVPKIKGTHMAMKSGMIAAETIFENWERLNEVLPFDQKIKDSWIAKELYRARNVRPGFHKGLFPGLIYAAMDQYVFRGNAPWTLHNHADHLSLKLKSHVKKIIYPKHDGKYSFDLTQQMFLSGTRYHENQPCHLKLKDLSIPIDYNLPKYDAPEQRYCPAGVYEILEKDNIPYLQINFANCVQCKTCDIKDPLQNIVWTPPEGGDGPNYVNF